MEKKTGLLLHPTSLPSNFGIGDLGEEALHFLQFLSETDQGYWQILPLTPPDAFFSPYQCFSAFAGNPLLISPDELLKEGLLKKFDLSNPSFPKDSVDFKRVLPFKKKIFREAFQCFRKGKSPYDYQLFCQENQDWLPNYSLFMALREHFQGSSWKEWPKEIAHREKGALEHYQRELAHEIDYHTFLQYMFSLQWQRIKKEAEKKEIQIIGDLPIFVAYESSDVWENPSLFTLNEDGGLAKVAGVPPDYFSATGQRWGNPLYHWDRMKDDDYSWWRRRISKLLAHVHLIRIDHFRGFEAYWEIDAKEKTAKNGRWVKGPGEEFFLTLEKHLGEIPVVAEDLGLITKEVKELRRNLNYPGMKVLQFAIEGGKKELLEILAEEDILLYTGTHDNNTTLGWYQNAQKTNKEAVQVAQKVLGIHPQMEDEEICWRFIEETMKGKAMIKIFPLQDLLALGEKDRMNTPGTHKGNWAFQYQKKDLTDKRKERFKELTRKHTENIRRHPLE